MFDSIDPRWDDPRDDDRHDSRGRDRGRDSRESSHDPRDVFLRGLDLPRARERELVVSRGRLYEISDEDSRTLATVGAFRVVPERDLPGPHDGAVDPYDGALAHLRSEGLVRIISLDEHRRGIVLTERGRELLEANRRSRDDERQQTFQVGISRPRELTHDAELYRAYLTMAARIREQDGDIRRVVLEQELKRDYQRFLQERNRDRPDSDGRPDRDALEIEQWALRQNLPYFEGQVHFPDFRIEYEHHGLERHEDVEVFTAHYRGAHAAERARAGFTCYRSRRVGGGGGRRRRDERPAEEF